MAIGLVAKRGLAVLAVGVALSVVACGGDESDGDAEFIAAADAICTELAQSELAAFAATAGPEASLDYLEEISDQRSETLERLDALGVPQESATAFADYLAKLGEARAAVEDGIAAVSAERPADLAQARVRARELRLEANQIGAGLGFITCAGVLSSDEQGQITQTLELSIDPEAARELCNERSTDAFIATRFESVAACTKAQSAPSVVEAVTVLDMHGVSDVSANVLLELGAADGESVEYEASLAYEDEVWKLNSIAPTSPVG